VSNLVALSELQDRVRELFDIERAVARFPAALLNRVINRAIGRLHDLTSDNKWAADRVLFTTTATDLEGYQLPRRAYRVLAALAYMGIADPQERFQMLRPLQKQEMFDYGRRRRQWRWGMDIGYNVIGNGFDVAVPELAPTSSNRRIVFSPRPNERNRVVLLATRVPETLTVSTQVHDFVHGWDNFVTYYSCRELALREEDSRVAEFDALVKREETQIKAAQQEEVIGPEFGVDTLRRYIGPQQRGRRNAGGWP